MRDAKLPTTRNEHPTLWFIGIILTITALAGTGSILQDWMRLTPRSPQLGERRIEERKHAQKHTSHTHTDKDKELWSTLLQGGH